jgi:predicted nucleic acid-binding protein
VAKSGLAALSATQLAFFDTNILIYTDDASSPEKQQRAIDLFTIHFSHRTAIVSLQVLQEYFAGATRKLKLAPEVAQRKVELLARGIVVRFEPRDVIAAIELHRLHHISFWDALIVHAARRSGATLLYSEDLHAGSVLGGVRVVNPFSA